MENGEWKIVETQFIVSKVQQDSEQQKFKKVFKKTNQDKYI